MDESLTLRDADFRYVAELVYDRFGINLGEHKRVLVAGRLQKRVRELGFSSYGEYFALIKGDPSGAEVVELMNRLTTNHSFFFRERDHFDFLASEVIPAVLARGTRGGERRLRIWSAGCAAGEEPYTIAMVLREKLGRELESMDTGILATDLSLSVLKEAQAGIYPSSRLRELPPAWRKTYFSPAGEDLFEVSPALRSLVLFKRLNLMTEHFPFKGGFDVVFCRNVMIYFDADTRKRLVRAIFEVVRPGGWLFIGHSESIVRDESPFSYVRPATYRRDGD